MCRALQTLLRFASPRGVRGPRHAQLGDKCPTVSAWSVERVESVRTGSLGH
jgi:hypothetical protein